MAHLLALGSSLLIGTAHGYKKLEDTTLYKSAGITSLIASMRIASNLENSRVSLGIKVASLLMGPPLIVGLTVLNGKYLGHAIKLTLE